MDKNLFQERVDELLLLEERAEKRAEDLLELYEQQQEKSHEFMLELEKHRNDMAFKVKKITKAAEILAESTENIERHYHWAVMVFLGATILSGAMVLGFYFWVR